jgi:hypothetical protein
MKSSHRWPRRKENSPETFKALSPLRVPGTVWMVDLKKAGDRAEYLFPRDRKKEIL